MLLALGIIVLSGSHYFLYLSLVHFFPAISATYGKTLAGIFYFLAISFVLSSIIAHIKENLFTRIFYFLSGFWLGFLTNLVLATMAVWLIAGISSFKNISINLGVLTIFFFILAFAYSVYGVWNAFHPKIKEISITIPELPEYWKNKKIIQLSDLHIGHIYKTDFVKRIVQKINAVNPVMVVITGDLFDGMDGDFESPLKILNEISPEKGAYFITGNHETFLDTKIIFSALEKTKIQALRDETIDIDGLKLTGINYPEHGGDKDVEKIIKNLQPNFFGKPNILLYHTPSDIDKITNNGVNLMLSGHTHKGQFFPFDFITHILFKGYDYGLHKIGDLTVYITNGAGTWGPTMRTGNAPEIVVITLN